MSTTQIALVTGAAGGIGREVARQLVDRGMQVIVTARSLQAATEATREVGGTPLILDVTDPRTVAAAVAVAHDLGGLDVLVNNAAAHADWQETALTADLEGEALDLMWQTNVVGPWRLTQAFAELLQASPNGRVVNVTSGSGSHGDEEYGLAGGPGMASYAVTKAAANALTRKLAAALPTLRVNAVDPGLTATAPGMEAMGARPVAEGAASVVWAASLPVDGPTGGFFRDGRPFPW
jgi:NAD(P)-dependent dehydrogenase (short-subunit alcohol dehydrogenase family)